MGTPIPMMGTGGDIVITMMIKAETTQPLLFVA